MKFLRDDQESEQQIDSIEGCRSGENTIKIRSTRTGGTMTFHSCSGFLVHFSTFLRTESPTEVLLRFVKMIMGNISYTEYVCRFCDLFGYDMMCNMVSTLLGERMHKLYYDDNEDAQITLYVFITFGLQRLFIDRFHSKTHKLEACNTSTGVFNFHHPKFEYVKKGVNDNICEQFWVRHNKLRPLRSTSTNHFDFSLLLSKELHNDERKRTLERNGWSWEPISNWEKRIDINEKNFKTWVEDIKSDCMRKWKPSWNEFINTNNTEYRISKAKRRKFAKTIENRYYNVWNTRSSNWKIDRQWNETLDHIHRQIITPLFHSSKQSNNSLTDMIKRGMNKKYHGDALFNKYRDTIKEYVTIIELLYKQYKRLSRSISKGKRNVVAEVKIIRIQREIKNLMVD